MANAILAYGNLIDAAELYGGSWQSSLPLANLQDRRLGQLARSASASAGDSWFDVDFGSTRLFRIVALVNHNLSVTAQYRIRLSTDPNFASNTANSGWTEVWPSVYPFGSLPWGSPSWWAGKYAADQIDRYTGTIVFVLSGLTAARYLRVEVNDGGNLDGYVQFGRLFAADGWQPTRNLTYGASLAWEDRSQVQEALSGAEYFDIRPPARIARFGLDAMTESEAMSQVFEIQRAMGIAGEVLFVWNPDDATHALRRRFLGRLRVLSPIENPGPDRWKAPFEIKELL